MSSLPFSHTSDLVDALRRIEQSTEEVFLELAGALPELVKEMNQSFEASDSAIRAMEQSNTAYCHDDEDASELSVSGIVTNTSEAVRGWADQFEQLSRRDAAIFAQLRDAIGNLEEISTSIEKIKLDSEEMEIVSLNAMTVALKAGNAGRAFSYITEELKRLSNRTVALSDSVSRSGRSLIESFSAFEQEIEETRTFQQEFIKTFQTRITHSVTDFERAVRSLIKGTRDLRDRSISLKQPINRMMETVQLQDLIRQSIDHIILALDVIRPEQSLETTKELLDELAFLRDIPHLAQTLIEDVARQIEQSTGTFLSLTDEAEEHLENLELEKSRFMKGKVRIDGTEVVSFDDLMQEMSGILDELVRDLNGNLRRKEELAKRSETITRSVEKLQSTFRTFHTLVNRFHSIDIAARIEVAKQKVLRSMENSTEQMTSLTKKIGNDVENSLASTREFIEATTTVMDNYRTVYREELLFGYRFREDMQNHYHGLKTGRECLTAAIGDFSLFTDRFFSVFARSKENGKRLRNTAAEIRSLNQTLDTLSAHIEQRYHEVLEREGLHEWTIEDTRLREIIERFTIFSHKRQAGEIAGLEVEDGVGAGDITLF